MIETNICLDAEMTNTGFRTLLPWKSGAMTLQEGRKPEGQRVVPGQMENTKGKKIWVDILISQEVERREIHFCFGSAVTTCKTKTQLRPVGQISRGKCCLLAHCFHQKPNGEDLTGTVLLVSLVLKSTSLQSSDFSWSRVRRWTFRVPQSVR